MEEPNENVRKRLAVSEEKSESEATTSHQRPKRHPVQDDKVYEGIRGHERHILFHFFTLFSISFFIGVVFIHLSLWTNANILNAASQDQSELADGAGQDPNTNPLAASSDSPPQTNTEGKSLPVLLQTTFYYTGKYFFASFNETRIFTAPS
uniref:Uncharacterized protein LOC100186744 n=1 Tax=Phallusia mammillata TaxID=59560 RepID=A0A6F9DHU3_9ASCI|nr:uncharacterized protein LOC100186744 [Phallusia mammillata]